MRRLVVAVGLIGLVSNAFAGDFEFPTLRGSSPFVPGTPTYTRWSGIYGGGHVGWGSAHFDFKNATQSLVEFILRESTLESGAHPSQWAVLGSSDSQRRSVGAFAGVNFQYDEIIVGVDITYSKSQFAGSAPVSPLTRVSSPGDGSVYTTTISGSASMAIHDYGTVRARAGWAAGSFMPFATVGLALARVDYARSATVQGTFTNDSGGPFFFGPWTESDTRKNAIVPGWAVGAGIDVMLLPNVFARVEYEYIGLSQIGRSLASINVGRVGAGFKF
jgi:opacity protein-like surface antigen